MFGKYYVVLGATHCCFSKATLSMPGFIVVAAMGIERCMLKVDQISSYLIG